MAYPIKMLRDEERQSFIPYTSTKAVTDGSGHILQDVLDVKLDPVDVKAGSDISVSPAKDNVTVNWVRPKNLTVQNNVTTTAAGNGVLDAYQGKVLNDKFNNYILSSEKGKANGVATLDGTGVVPAAQLPSYVDDVIEAYIVSGSTALSAGWLSLTASGAALTPEKGKIYVVLTAGQYQDHQYRWGGSTYVLCNPSDVNSVNGKTGVVVLDALTIQKNGTQVGETYNGGAAKTINIEVPTKTSDITNDSGYITASADITGNAATATNATNDKNGNQIDTTYLKKAGDTMTGVLKFDTSTFKSTDTPIISFENLGGIGASADGKSLGIYATSGVFFGAPNGNHRIVLEDSTSTLRPDAGTWNLGATNAKWNNVYANTFHGNLDGNATTATSATSAGSATKATQDQNGDVIDTTYLKLSGGTMTGTITNNRDTTWRGGVLGTNAIISTTTSTPTYHASLWSFNTANGRMEIFKHSDYAGIGYASNTKLDSGENTLDWYISVFEDKILAPNVNKEVNLGGGANRWKNVYAGNLYTSGYLYIGDDNVAVVSRDTSINSLYLGSSALKLQVKALERPAWYIESTWKGDFAMLSDIPTKISQLTDDSSFVKNTDKASTTAYGIIKLGTGLAVNADGYTYVTGEGVLADSVDWSKVANKPSKVSYWTNDAGYITSEGTAAIAKKTTGTLTIQKNGTTIESFNGSGNVTANIVVPTKLSEFTDDISNKFMRATKTGRTSTETFSYYGMAAPNGDVSDWIRTTYNGIIPYTNGTISSLGTPTWTFATAWINTVHAKTQVAFGATNTETGDAAIKYNSVNKCMEFIFA